MYFIFKLSVVILILYLKCNALNTKPLIEHNKSYDDSAITKTTNSSSSSSSNNSATDNNTTTIITNSTAAASNLLSLSLVNGSANYDNTKIDNINNNVETDDGDGDGENDSNQSILQGRLSATQSPRTTTKTTTTTTNLTTIKMTDNVKNHRLETIRNEANYFYYNIIEKGNNTSTPAESDYNDEGWQGVTTTVAEIEVPTTTTSTATTTNHTEQRIRKIQPNDDPENDWQLTLNNSDYERYILKYESDGGNSCLLDGTKDFFMWWSYPNGSLRFLNLNVTNSNRFYLDLSFSNVIEDDKLFLKAKRRTYFSGRDTIIAFSAANNVLTQTPFRTLSLFNGTLKYLTLKGNQFAAYSSASSNGIAWAIFPLLNNLIELDVSKCGIEYVTKEAFGNMPNLRRLFISHNKMLSIPADTFHHIPLLQYLDLSCTNVIDNDYQIPLTTLNAVFNLIYGVKIHQNAFKGLSELVYLDLSHTKLTRNSAVAFAHLGEKLKFLSLCYTAFPIVGNVLFKNTALVGLDLSGNPYAANNIIDDAFEGVADTLKYLFFERSNLKDLTWMKWLVNLKVLGLSGNNINSVSLELFSPLLKLRVLDLSSNHIGNWYNRAFTNNLDLRVLNVRDNNINWINVEMVKDFGLLEYLSLGDNNFVCDCVLRELVDIAAENNKEAECSGTVINDAHDILADNMDLVQGYLMSSITELADKVYHQYYGTGHNATMADLSFNDFSNALKNRYKPLLQNSYQNIKAYNKARQHIKMHYLPRFYQVLSANGSTQCLQTETVSTVNGKLNGSALKFQLLDYDEEHYWCFNETERLHFVELNCQVRSYTEEEFAKKLHNLTTYVVASLCSVVGLSLLGILIYLKRWHILYYYSSFKSAALLSAANKEHITDHDANLVYDIFISYCQSDRQWVLDELLPNVEDTDNISICLHERDFEIGVTILDNIVNCMDRSRALMLIISSNFLLSHWCKFEMYLAQHRIFEVSKEHLIIVFLEDIPRNKRPKTLNYLMEVKTYIKWPAPKGTNKQVKPEERKLFWKRLKRTLENIGIDHMESHA